MGSLHGPAQGADVRHVAKIARVVMYPSRDDKIEIPGGEIVAVGFEGGTMIVVQRAADGVIRRWVNVPCMVEHEPPSGLVAPAGPMVIR